MKLTLLVLLFGSFVANAASLEWSGLYRVEGHHITRPDLKKGTSKEKEYGLQHLVLMPKIEAADGVTIRGRFGILNNTTYANSQLGEYFGNGVGTGTPTSTENSNVISQTQKPASLSVQHLYMTLNQEFGSFIVGRAPIHFGLGMTYNAGMNDFDHWMDTRDVFGYKMIFGNFFFLPMIGKVSEGNITGGSDDVTDYMAHLQYVNPETDWEFGVFYKVTRVGQAGNDAPGQPVFGDVAQNIVNKFESTQINIYSSKETEKYRFAIEAGNQSGNTGIRNGASNEVSLSGFGVAAEYEYKLEASKWAPGINFGWASGDDATTAGEFEGYIFDRNYDVAFLLMNHTLGQANIFRTSYLGVSGTSSTTAPDIEAISNVMYLSPYVKYQWKDKWAMDFALTTGVLNQTKNLAGNGKTADSNLGFELDFGLDYKPNKNITWRTQVGIFMPGAAFELDGQYETDLTYGLTTKAAINF